ncbi:MAG: hypothetical protein COU65_00880 [Candidatus Pacebacteria bacterium CG10_big_fil_rev_8_21_14_0_10_42_12]|nr:hypothetical protein [Candidatus Paceibacterota bacterium]PIR62914.1 MAG: hypothetical protein COU65_00880 [Candidatus Pacebacteria bacterium CG10_big_fil_rev_8_21_14_0_10_42_12]
MQDFAQSPSVADSTIDAYQPPADDSFQPVPPADPMPTSDPAPAVPSQVTEALEDQNIFDLLGVSDGTDEQKEEFLTELQDVLWEDFLEYDAQLLVTKDEYAELKQLRETHKDNVPEQQEAVVGYLEKLIPDLEEIMLEKALELKSDMVKERIAGMKELYSDDAAYQGQLTEAEAHIAAGRWHSAAVVLNSAVKN